MITLRTARVDPSGGYRPAQIPQLDTPQANLSFLSKLLEGAAQARLEVFLDSRDLMPTMQSASNLA